MRKAYISKDANAYLVRYLNSAGFQVEFVQLEGVPHERPSNHADMLMCRLGAGKEANVFAGSPSEIGRAYPESIRFNAVCLDRYFIHNLKHTSPALLDEARVRGLEFICVRQGYTKCNIVVVDGHSVITSDEGIFRVLSKYSDIDTLKIHSGFVKLKGFDCGFLGGASGRVDNEIVFNGALSRHPDFSAICNFIADRGLEVRFFPEYELEDIGSVIAE